MNFDKYVDLGNHYHNLDIEDHHHLKKSSLILFCKAIHLPQLQALATT